MGLTGMAAEAADPQRMRAIIDQYLLRPGDHPVEVAACQVEFTRRGGPRSLFQYQVTLRDPTDGREWTQAVSGVAYGGEQRTRRAAERLQRHYPPGPPATGTALVRAAYVPELDLLLQVFPFDHQLPVLEPLMAGPLPGLVAPLLAQFGPGDWHFAGWEAEAVRYRVDLRACVRLTIHAREDGTGEGAERHFFAKIYASERGGRAILEHSTRCGSGPWRTDRADRASASGGLPARRAAPGAGPSPRSLLAGGNPRSRLP